MARIAKLERAYRENPQTPLFACLADSYLERGSVDEARRMCEEGCERFPDYPTGFMILSKCYEAQNKLEDARMAIDRSLRLDANNPGGYVRLSQIYEGLGIATLAFKSMQKASALDPFNDTLAEQLEELAVAAEDDPGQVEDPEPATSEAATTDLVTTDAAASEPVQTTIEPVPDIDLEGAAQSGMDAYAKDPNISLPAEAVAQQDTYDPLITMAADVLTPSSETAQEPPLEFGLTSLDLDVPSTADPPSSMPPDLLLEIAIPDDEMGDGLIPADEETTVAAESVDLGIETLTLAEVDSGPPKAEELVDLGVAIFGEDEESQQDGVVEGGSADPNPESTADTPVPAPAAEVDVDLITFSHGEDREPEDPDLGPPDLTSFESDAPSAPSEQSVESTAPAASPPEPAGESSPAEAVELISFEEEASFQEEVDPGPPPQESSGAVELISFDDEEWVEGEQSAEPVGETPVPTPTDATLFEFEAQDVVAAARSGPEGGADVVDLFQEIESHPGGTEEGAGTGNPDAAQEEDGGVTETLAQIYASQGLIQRAIDTYHQLLEREPDNERLRQQLAELQQRSEDTG